MKRQFAFIFRTQTLTVTLLTLAALFASTATAQQSAPTITTSQSARQVSGEPKLHEAARVGDLVQLRAQLKRGVSPNLRDSYGRTALIEAAEAGQIEAARVLIQHGADLNTASRTGTALEAAERSGHMKVAALLRQSGARSSGHSLGDIVCVRPWGGDGYCGIIESIGRNNYQLRVTEIVGCKDGCLPKPECSDNRAVGGADGIKVGDKVETVSWCLTHTGVQR